MWGLSHKGVPVRGRNTLKQGYLDTDRTGALQLNVLIITGRAKNSNISPNCNTKNKQNPKSNTRTHTHAHTPKEQREKTTVEQTPK